MGAAARWAALRLAAAQLLTSSGPAAAQDIEPRRWSVLPVGTNILGVGHAYTSGDIAFDPLLNVEGATVNVRTWGLSYLHAFRAFGRPARIDVQLAQQHARWKGLLDGSPREVDRRGLDDPSIRLSVNLLGPPAMDAKSLRAFHAANPVYTVAGAALAVRLPLGEYQRDKLLNLGQNRFVIRPQAGLVHRRGPWSFELTGSVFFYTDNDAFNRNQTRAQDPLFAGQTHVVYTGDSGWWVSAGAAYAGGGESSVDGVRKDDARRELLYGVSAGAPLNRRISVKIAYVGRRSEAEIGADTDNLAVAVSMRF